MNYNKEVNKYTKNLLSGLDPNLIEIICSAEQKNKFEYIILRLPCTEEISCCGQGGYKLALRIPVGGNTKLEDLNIRKYEDFEISKNDFRLTFIEIIPKKPIVDKPNFIDAISGIKEVANDLYKILETSGKIPYH
jgi:hypothetical protein